MLKVNMKWECDCGYSFRMTADTGDPSDDSMLPSLHRISGVMAKVDDFADSIELHDGCPYLKREYGDKEIYEERAQMAKGESEELTK